MVRRTGRLTKPSSDDIAAAENATVPDVIAPGLKVLFCGYNPGLYSGAVGYHFARPGNRFWPTLYRAGFTPRVLKPWEEEVFVALGYGLTNFVERATAGAADLSREELREGRERLAQTVRHFRPRFLAVLGLGAYRTAFAQPGATVGPIGPFPDADSPTTLWLLPNPSGLNAYYQKQLPALFAELRRAVEQASADRSA